MPIQDAMKQFYQQKYNISIVTNLRKNKLITHDDIKNLEIRNTEVSG